MPRVARKAPGGLVYHVLNRGAGRMTLFRHDEDYLAFLRCLAAALEACPGVRLLAYCLMPNHWHLVLWPTRDGELGRFMQRLTVTHVRRHHQHRGTVGGGHVYQGTYKSFPAQADEHFLVLCRYVERNALRAGLVRRAEDWRWSSLRARRSPGADPAAAAMLRDWPVDRPRGWARLVNTPQTAAEEQALRECVRRGRPFGGDAWQRRTATRLGLAHTFRQRGRPRKTKADK